MVDPFALISGFLIICISAVVAYRVKRLVPAAIIIGAIVVVASIIAVTLGLFAEAIPLFVIYLNGGFIGALGGYTLLQRNRANTGN